MQFFIRKSLFLAIALFVGVMTTAVKAEGLEVLFALYGDLNANNASLYYSADSTTKCNKVNLG